jgi:hypothetical protein
MADFLTEEGTLILTGMIITFLTGFLYTMTAHGFKSGGKYRKKHEAVAIYLGAMGILGLFTPLINEVSKVIIRLVPIVSIFGVFIICANFILHHNIRKWRHTSVQSLLIYFSGAFLVVFGYLLTSLIT